MLQTPRKQKEALRVTGWSYYFIYLFKIIHYECDLTNCWLLLTWNIYCLCILTQPTGQPNPDPVQWLAIKVFGPNLLTYQVGAHFKALDEGVHGSPKVLKKYFLCSEKRGGLCCLSSQKHDSRARPNFPTFSENLGYEGQCWVYGQKTVRGLFRG